MHGLIEAWLRLVQRSGESGTSDWGLVLGIVLAVRKPLDLQRKGRVMIFILKVSVVLLRKRSSRMGDFSKLRVLRNPRQRLYERYARCPTSLGPAAWHIVLNEIVPHVYFGLHFGAERVRYDLFSDLRDDPVRERDVHLEVV